ncbi:MAG: glycosyltransferase [Candidatus Hydrogenedentes bacterium]|nr:glycosyltransferase [Candidatus Hydrogenedentota bacterium]
MPELSLVMIVKNEERQLLHCLDSVRDIVNDAVVADTGSSDRTVDVAREWGARVMEVPWTDDFSAARNTALAAAAGDWVLHLDADEYVDPESARAIRRLLEQEDLAADAVEVLIANYCDDARAWRWQPAAPGSPYAHSFSGYIPVPLLRLFRNRRGFYYSEPVHENITQSVAERGGRVLPRHDIVIHHYGYHQESQRRGAKAELYLRIARQKRELAPRDLKALHDLAEQALACGLTDEAENACREALAMDPMHIPAIMTLANICLNRGDLAEAYRLLARIEAAPEAPAHVSIGLSAIEYREGRQLQAMSRLERLLEREPHALLARLYLARIYDRFGSPDRALRQLELAHLSAPTIKEFKERLAALKQRRNAEQYFQNGMAPEALETLVSALRLDPEDPLIHNDLGVVLHALDQPAKAAESFRRALQLAPGLADAEENMKRIKNKG